MNRKFTRLVFLAATFPLACSAGNEPVDNGNFKPGGLECAVPGATACATACVDLQTGLNNGGNCASACGAGQTCRSGVCSGRNNARSGGARGSGGARRTGA